MDMVVVGKNWWSLVRVLPRRTVVGRRRFVGVWILEREVCWRRRWKRIRRVHVEEVARDGHHLSHDGYLLGVLMVLDSGYVGRKCLRSDATEARESLT